jgi:YD repeat-containing protein
VQDADIYVAACSGSESPGRVFDIAVANHASKRSWGSVVSLDLTFHGRVTSIEAPDGWRSEQDYDDAWQHTRIRWTSVARGRGVKRGSRLGGFRVKMAEPAAPPPCACWMEFGNGVIEGSMCSMSVARAG